MLRHIKQLFAFLFIAFLMAIIAGVSIYYVLAPQLPPTESLKEIQLQTPLRIYSAEVGTSRRIGNSVANDAVGCPSLHSAAVQHLRQKHVVLRHCFAIRSPLPRWSTNY